MPLWVYVVCVLLACVCALLYVLERRRRSKFCGLPCFPLLPFIGNIHQLIGDGRHVFYLFDRMGEICEKSGLPFVVWMGPIAFFVTQDPDDVRAITNTFIEKPYFYRLSKNWLGDGLVSAPGYVWKHNIKIIGGTFSSSVVHGFLGVFNVQAHKLVEDLKTEVGKEPFDIIHKYLAYTTLETICQTALGVPKISESILTTEYNEAFNRCLELVMSRGLNMLLHPDAIYRLTAAHRELAKCVAVLNHLPDTVMKERKLERKNAKKTQMGENNYSVAKDGPKVKTFLDILMDLSETDPSLTEKQIKSEVNTVIFGGQETAASTMLYILLMIGCRPRIQEKLNAEMKSIFGDSRRDVSKEDLSQMVYCEAVIYETLRLYPPFPGVLREADRDLPLKSCTIPKGTICTIHHWGAGRSVRLWGPDAKVYRPERWLGDQPPGTSAAFLAFSYGRRACIGNTEAGREFHTLAVRTTNVEEKRLVRQDGMSTKCGWYPAKYAMAILKTMLAHCVRELEFVSEADNLQLKIDLALRPVSGHLVQVKLR